MLQREDINKLILAGENSFIEFKSAEFNNESLAKEIAAFANMKGGQIFIGISDDGTLESIIPNTEERVINICRNNIQPSLIPDIETLLVADKKILHLNIEKGQFKPYKVKSSNKFYIRAGSVSIEPSNEELVRLFQDGQQLHFEISPLYEFERTNFDLIKFRDYIESYRGLEFSEDELNKLLYNTQCVDEQYRVNVLGNLFFAKNPTRPMPQNGIELNCFDGNSTVDNLIDYKSLTGNLIQCIESSLNFVKNFSKNSVTFNAENGKREEQPDFDAVVIREIVVNAFMHRDWSIFGQRIRLNIFNDRLELFSPGKLPNTLNIERALAGISYYRNPIISQMLKDYQWADRIGRGLQKVVNYYHNHKLKPPKFEVDNESFKVTLWRSVSLI